MAQINITLNEEEIPQLLHENRGGASAAMLQKALAYAASIPLEITAVER